KSSAGTRSGPRSRPTTLRPALLSSRAAIAPVHPMPTMTASTSFKRMVTSASSREVRDRFGRRDVALVEISIDLVGVGRRQAGEAEHRPGNFVAVAAVHRVGEEPLHHPSVQADEERARGEILELRRAVFHGGKRGGAVGGREAIELLAV